MEGRDGVLQPMQQVGRAGSVDAEPRVRVGPDVLQGLGAVIEQQVAGGHRVRAELAQQMVEIDQLRREMPDVPVDAVELRLHVDRHQRDQQGGHDGDRGDPAADGDAGASGQNARREAGVREHAGKGRAEQEEEDANAKPRPVHAPIPIQSDTVWRNPP